MMPTHSSTSLYVRQVKKNYWNTTVCTINNVDLFRFASLVLP